MSKTLNAIKAIVPALFGLFAVACTFMDQWDRGAFYMAMACFLVLIGDHND